MDGWLTTAAGWLLAAVMIAAVAVGIVRTRRADRTSRPVIITAVTAVLIIAVAGILVLAGSPSWVPVLVLALGAIAVFARVAVSRPAR